jgi:hypothetical protein
VAKAEKLTEEQLSEIRAGLPDMRSRFFEALEDPDHPAWEALLQGVNDGHHQPLQWTMDRHPFGHLCGVCHAWRRQNRDLAEIEMAVLRRRGDDEAIGAILAAAPPDPVCEECGEVFPRSIKGRQPRLCPPCRDEVRREAQALAQRARRARREPPPEALTG